MRSDFQPFQIKPLKEDKELDDSSQDPHESEQKKKKKTAIGSYLGSKLEELILAAVPYDKIKEYPPNFMLYTGSFLIILITLFFVANFAYLFQSNLGQVFLSPLSSPDSSANCKAVPSSNTGTFFATKKGLWAGGDGFNYAEAGYQLTVTNLELTPHEYDLSMSSLYGYVNGLGIATSGFDLAINLLNWFSFTALQNEGVAANRFNLIGDPAITFNRQNIFGAISSVAGDCYLDGQFATMDVANGNLLLTIPVDAYINNTLCSQAGGDLAYLGFDSYAGNTQFQLQIDVRSLVTAIAVNYGILPLEYLSEIVVTRITDVNSSITYSRYYDPKYPGMTPISCLRFPPDPDVKDSSPFIICSLNLHKGTVAVPFFHHSGSDSSNPVPCNCSTLTVEDLADKYHPCNAFTFIAGFLYFPSAASLQLTFDLVFTAGGPNALQLKIFAPAWVASFYGGSSFLYEDHYNTPSVREQLYSFCSLKGTVTDDSPDPVASNCSLITFSLFDSTPDWTISKYYYQLTNGACQNSIGTTWDNW
jgi:hypothetical protein